MDKKSAKDILAEKLVELREKNNITQQTLADELGVTRQSLSLYEKAERTINIDLLLEIAKYFNVSTDYLLGISENKTTNAEMKDICDYTGLSDDAVEFLHSLVEKTKDKENHEYIFKAISLLFSSGESSKDFIRDLVGYIYSEYGNNYFVRKFENEEARKHGALHIPINVLDQNTLQDIEYFLLGLKMSMHNEPKGGYYYFYGNEEQNQREDGENNGKHHSAPR